MSSHWNADPGKGGEPLVRQCPEWGAMVLIKAQSYSECGYRFVVQMQPPRLPEATAGKLEQVNGNLLDAEQLQHMPYRRLVDWCGSDDICLATGEPKHLPGLLEARIFPKSGE